MEAEEEDKNGELGKPQGAEQLAEKIRVAPHPLSWGTGLEHKSGVPRPLKYERKSIRSCNTKSHEKDGYCGTFPTRTDFLSFASMTEVKFEGLFWPQNEDIELKVSR